MTTEHSHNEGRHPCGRRISRRDFIKLVAISGLVAGCGPVREQVAGPTTTPAPAPTNTPAPNPTPTPAPAITPTSTLAAAPSSRRPSIVKMYPDVPSRVVHARHTGVWDGDKLVPGAIRQMLDASITKLTGLDDVDKAWAALFDPGERIVIKVNTIRNSLFWTHVPLVMAVTERLQGVGVPPEQIVVFDRTTEELTNAGFSINKEGPGVRCYGTDTRYTAGWTVAGLKVQLTDILLNCDALINMPLLKSHILPGITFAMKNHFGTFDKPESFHSTAMMMSGIAELNALSPIRDRQRLIIGDALRSTLKEATSWPYWRDAIPGDSVFMSFDPVAHDTVGLQHWCQLKAEHGESTEVPVSLASRWLQKGADLGLGTNNLDNVDLVKVNLG